MAEESISRSQMFGAHVVVRAGYEVPFDDEVIVTLTDSGVTLEAPAQSMKFDWLDVEDTVSESFEFVVHLADERLMFFTGVGRQYEEFVGAVNAAWRAEILRSLLPGADSPYKTFECSYLFHDPAGQRHEVDSAKVELYPDSLVAVPESSDLIHLFYHDIVNTYFEAELFTAKLSASDGSNLTLRRLGRRFSEFQLALEHLRFMLSESTTAGLKSMIPDYPESGFYRVAQKMGGGQAANHKTVESCAKGLWMKLEAAVCRSDAARFHLENLKALAGEDGVYLGVRFAKPGTPPATWYVAVCPKHRVVAAETTSESPSTTYLFRLREGDAATEAVNLNRAFLLLNHHLEALAASDQALVGGDMRRFRQAVRKLPEVASARQSFLAVVPHVSDAVWKAALDLALSKAGR